MDVRLRSVAPGDEVALQAIGPDHEAYLGFGGDPSGDPTGGPGWARTALEPVKSAYFGRIIECDDEIAGAVRLHTENLIDRNARLAIWIYRPELCGKGMGQRAISLALDEAFGPLGLHRIDLRVLATNTRAIRAYEAAGFHHEGRLRDSARIGDGFEDDLVMSILATDPRPKLS